MSDRLWSRRRPRGVVFEQPSPEEIARHERQRQAEVARARAAAFDGVATLPLEEVTATSPTGDLVYAGVDHQGQLILALSTADASTSYAGRDISSGWASFPHSTAAVTYPMQILTIVADGSTTETQLPVVSVAFPFVQPLPDGNWLVVGARSHYRESGPEENAAVYGPTGQQIASFCVGDGINDVQTTPSGQVWASYGDEGVFGNFGWGLPGPEPLGRSGLARWSPSGERTLELEPPESLSTMADCYALNVIGEDAWACYYTDFPIVHVSHDGSTRGWATDASGPQALAVGTNGRVGIVGGYDGLLDRLLIADLSDDEIGAAVTYKLVMPDLTELPVDARVLARGRFVHVVTDNHWLRLDISRIQR